MSLLPGTKALLLSDDFCINDKGLYFGPVPALLLADKWLNGKLVREFEYESLLDGSGQVSWLALIRSLEFSSLPFPEITGLGYNCLP